MRIERLFAAPFGARILQAEKLHREFKFSLLTDAVEFAPAAAGEQVMLQGVVDCFWEEADGIVLVDFKTDRTPDGPQACAECLCQSADKNLRRAGQGKNSLFLLLRLCVSSRLKTQPANRTFPVCGLNCYPKMHRFPDGLCLILRVKQKRGEKAEDHCGGDAACGSF